MPYLTREQILEVKDLQFEDVEVPEWGGTLRVRGLTGIERDRFEETILDQRGKNVKVKMTNLRARLVALSVVDEQGQALFTQNDIGVLGRKSAAALQRVFNVAQRLSGFSDEDLEELAKNSSDAQSDGSISD
jgi:hypothetical protein